MTDVQTVVMNTAELLSATAVSQCKEIQRRMRAAGNNIDLFTEIDRERRRSIDGYRHEIYALSKLAEELNDDELYQSLYNLELATATALEYKSDKAPED